MPKQHFIAIAQLLEATNASEATIFALALYFSQTKPLVDKAKFVEACGEDSKKVA